VLGNADHGQTNWRSASAKCNLYSITTNQAAIMALFRVINRYVGNLAQSKRSESR
jgi:hypothetical protein